MILAPGDIVDRYLVEAFVGRGGLAEVYAVRHTVLETRHALKVLRQATRDQAERLVREGRVQAHIDHPNVVPVRDVFDVGGTPALLMPLVDGPTLRDVIRRDPPDHHTAIALFREVVAGVRHVHDRGLIHRDLKPGNVLIELRGRSLVPRVTDFGLVKELAGDHDTQMGGFMGTPAYASPEQLRVSSQVDARADLWSLGVILYELLVGDLPFGEMELLALSRGDTTWRPRIDPLLVEPGWGELIAELLSIAPENRPGSAADLDARLDELGVPPAHRSPWLQVDGPLALAVLELRRPSGRVSTGGASTEIGGQPSLVSPGLRAVTDRAMVTLTEPGARSNITPPIDRLFGRADDRKLVRSLLDDGTRIVTLTGTAGTGKTRLATEVALAGARDRTGGAWLAAIEAAFDEDAVCSEVAAALELTNARGVAAEAIGRELARRGPTILVIDNAEQAVDAVARLVGRWAAAAPATQFLVTSRIPLDADGERVVRLAPLELPDDDELGPAAELFIDRARNADARFTLEDADRPHLAAIVRELDGLPLAIELAAARVRLMSLRAIRERLDERFALLRSQQRRRDTASRHVTLRTALDGSWELLTGWEREALAQLGTFAAPFTLEDAESVVHVDAWPDAGSTIDAVANLVDHSLVQVVREQAGDREPRYRLLVSVRAYALVQLGEAGAIVRPDGSAGSGPAALREAEERHGRRFARWGARSMGVRAWQLGRDDVEALHRAGEDLFLAAERAIERGDGAVAGDAAMGISRYAIGHGPVTRGLPILRRIAAMPELSAAHRTALLTDIALLHLYSDSVETTQAFEHALEQAQSSDDLAGAARALRGLATEAIERGALDEADALLTAASDVFGGDPPDAERAQIAFTTATLRIHQVRNEEAEALLKEADAHARLHGDAHFAGVIASWQHVLMMKQGRHAESRAALVVALEAAVAEGHAVNHARYLRSMALLDRLEGDLGSAQNTMDAAIAIQELVTTGPIVSYSLHAAMTALERGDVEAAASYFERYPTPKIEPAIAAWVARAAAGATIIDALQGDAPARDRGLAHARRAAERTGIRAVHAQILCYEGLGALAMGHLDAARDALAEATAIADDLGVHTGSVEGHELRWLRDSVAIGRIRVGGVQR